MQIPGNWPSSVNDLRRDCPGRPHVTNAHRECDLAERRACGFKEELALQRPQRSGVVTDVHMPEALRRSVTDSGSRYAYTGRVARTLKLRSSAVKQPRRG